jgi:PiT family inorganic phosphate transporter
VRWGVAGNIVVAWVLTLPAAAAVGALTYLVISVLGVHTAGPVVVSGALVVLLLATFVRRIMAGRTLTAEA